MAGVLKTTTVKRLATTQVTLLDHSCTITQGLQILADNRILSAPIVNRSSNTCLGSVDVLDLLFFLLTGPKDPKVAWNEEVKRRLTLPAYHAIDYSFKNPFTPVVEDCPVSDVVAKLFTLGVHRVPVVDRTMHFTGIIAQMDVISFLCKEFDKDRDQSLMTLARRPLSSMDFRGEVIAVNHKTKLIDAFSDIVINGISGIAVVNDQNKLIGNLSASDFEGILEATLFDFANKTLGEIIKNQELVYVTRLNTLEETIQKLHKHNIHRVYVLNHELIPIGLVSTTDVMHILTNELQLA